MKKLSTKVDSIPSDETKADSDTLLIANSSSHNSTKPVVVGSLVRFYDCDRANKDRNHSGEPKYYSVGMVINRRITEKMFVADIELGGDDVVDIRLPDGRMSNGHFTNGVVLV